MSSWTFARSRAQRPVAHLCLTKGGSSRRGSRARAGAPRPAGRFPRRGAPVPPCAAPPAGPPAQRRQASASSGPTPADRGPRDRATMRPMLASIAANRLRISSGKFEKGGSTRPWAITSTRNDGLMGLPLARFHPFAILTSGTKRSFSALFLAVDCSLCVSGFVLIHFPVSLSGISYSSLPDDERGDRVDAEHLAVVLLRVVVLLEFDGHRTASDRHLVLLGVGLLETRLEGLQRLDRRLVPPPAFLLAEHEQDIDVLERLRLRVPAVGAREAVAARGRSCRECTPALRPAASMRPRPPSRRARDACEISRRPAWSSASPHLQ